MKIKYSSYNTAVKSIIAYLISSLTIFLISLFPRDKYTLVATILALIFWIFLIAGIFFTVKLYKSIKTKGKATILNFFNTKQMKIIDMVLASSIFLNIVFIVLFNILQFNLSWLQTFLIFLSIFSIELHCVFSITSTKNK